MGLLQKTGSILRRLYRSAACAGLVAGAASAAEDYSQWAHSADVYLNTTPGGADVTSTVPGFPVLVRLTGAEFGFAQALGKGQDIRFVAGNGRRMPHQIERWDSAGAAAEIWVKVDTVFGDSANQAFKLYWGMPSAADSSNSKAVFDSAEGYAAVWHLGGAGARANSVAGGNDAVPVNYKGTESRPGVAGLCDSLDGGSPGGYLNLGKGYASFSSGFTYSVWAYPAAAAKYGKLLDLGNGQAVDNIAFYRVATSNDLAFKNWHGVDTSKTVLAPGALALGQWQHFVLTVMGREVRIYRNGDLIKSDSIANTIKDTVRASNFLGRSNWATNAYYAGKYDEPWISTRARGADWVRLCYANQKSGQTLVSFQKAAQCRTLFAAPADTAASEGSSLVLAGTADCADQFSWSVVSGPANGIFDPYVKTLQVFLPRVKADTAIVYRFSAHFPDSTRTRDVRIAVKETVPDPIFTLNGPQSWDGNDSLVLAPSVSNLAAIKASADPVLNYSWSVSGPTVDTSWRDTALVLRRCRNQGNLQVTLCLDNNGAPACQSETIAVSAATGIRKDAKASRLRAPAPRRDLNGRLAGGKPAGYLVPDRRARAAPKPPKG